MADRKEAKRILDELPAQDAKALEELAGLARVAGAAEASRPTCASSASPCRRGRAGAHAQARARGLLRCARRRPRARRTPSTGRGCTSTGGRPAQASPAPSTACKAPRRRQPCCRRRPRVRCCAADQVAARALRAGRHRGLGRAEPESSPLRAKRAALAEAKTPSISRRRCSAPPRPTACSRRGRDRRAGDRRARAELRARRAPDASCCTGPTSRSPRRRCARCASRSPRRACASSGRARRCGTLRPDPSGRPSARCPPS